MRASALALSSPCVFCFGWPGGFLPRTAVGASALATAAVGASALATAAVGAPGPTTVGSTLFSTFSYRYGTGKDYRTGSPEILFDTYCGMKTIVAGLRFPLKSLFVRFFPLLFEILLYRSVFQPVLWIRDMLARILGLVNPDPALDSAIFVLGLHDAVKNLFFCLLLFEDTFT